MAKVNRDIWAFPAEIAHDLDNLDSSLLTPTQISEVLACAWEYARCVIPEFTNWARYIAFCRIIIIGVIVEFRGDLINVLSPSPTSSSAILGVYDIEELLDILFGPGNSPIRHSMGREYWAFLTLTSYKSSAERRHSGLFRCYVHALAGSARNWFRLRDCDALARFTMAAALACNNHDNFWFNEDELTILTELCDTMYDAATYYKHRAEGETNNTFAYAPPTLRVESYRQYRQILWQLDVEWSRLSTHRCIINFMRTFGGPIHMMMRRYRYVEDGLTLGNPETDAIVTQTRRNVKLWNRLDQNQDQDPERDEDEANGHALVQVVKRQDSLLFDGMAEMLSTCNQSENEGDKRCADCEYKTSYGVKSQGDFGGVRLCLGCTTEWGLYLESFPDRAAVVFPFLHNSKSKSKSNGQSITSQGLETRGKRRAHGLDNPVRNGKRRRV